MSWPIRRRSARGDAVRFERSDVTFHYALAGSAKNPIFSDVRDGLAEWLTSPEDHLQQVAALVRRSQERTPYAPRHLR
jgi:DNA-binding FadR family transcriptional regulator